MKLHFKVFLIGFFASNFLFAQENQKEKSVFKSYPELKIYGGIPVALGDNFLNEGHNPSVDLGFYLSPFSVYGFNFGIGLDYSNFQVSDASVAGNGSHTNLFHYYAYLSYPLAITQKIDFEPKFGLGGSYLNQKRNDKNFGKMDGLALNFGANLEYELAHPLEIFIGTDYFYSKFDVDAPGEYKSFFEKINKLNVFVGIKFNFRQKEISKNEDLQNR
jgi:hypothetical protein